MKLHKKSVCHFLLAILCVSLTGCGSISRVEPLGSSYEEVSYTRHSFSEPEATQITLQYRKPNGGRIMIWPSAGGVVVRNDVAVFVGDKAWKQPPFGERWPMKPRLFAVKAPELPLDITDEVLWRWSKQSKKNFTEIFGKDYIRYSKETNNVLEFHFFIVSIPDWKELNISMEWSQLSDIMREVKEKGVIHKDLRWGTTYIEKEFKLEVQK